MAPAQSASADAPTVLDQAIRLIIVEFVSYGGYKPNSMWETQFIRILKDRFEAANKKNPGFSQRAFARRLGISPGALSEIMRRKRTVSARRAMEIVTALEVETSELERFRKLALKDRDESRMLLSNEAFELVSRWYYSAMISLFNLDVPPKTVEDVAEYLNLDIQTAREAVERLTGYELLRTDENGHITATGQHFITQEDVPSSAVRTAHLEGLEMAKQALNQYSVEEREFTSILFDAGKCHLKEGKEEIRRFRDNLTEIMQTSERDTVYRLNIQLFPVAEAKKRRNT